MEKKFMWAAAILLAQVGLWGLKLKVEEERRKPVMVQIETPPRAPPTEAEMCAELQVKMRQLMFNDPKRQEALDSYNRMGCAGVLGVQGMRPRTQVMDDDVRTRGPANQGSYQPYGGNKTTSEAYERNAQAEAERRELLRILNERRR